MDYDLICVGGGLGGAALAKCMAEHGARVLVVERETHFRDRVRGEYLHSWGAVEARELGLTESLRAAGARDVPLIDVFFGPMRVSRTDVTKGHRPSPICLSHPAVQGAVLDAATRAGAEVERPATVTQILPGPKPEVEIRDASGRRSRASARLVVGADGRDSRVRRWGDFAAVHDTERLCIAGLLLDEVDGLQDAICLFWNFAAGDHVLLFPLGGRRARAYVAYRASAGVRRLSGRERVPDFLSACLSTGVPRAWLERAEPAGPLAAFEGADSHVDHPHRGGIALIGDAAACSDPTWGCGLSLTLRDVRTLRDRLLAAGDWEAAANDYALEHDRYYGRIHTLEDWLTTVLFDPGPDADARRARVFAKLAVEPERQPNLVGRGPACQTDEDARRRFFAED